MAKIRLSLKELDVDSFSVMPDRGPGHIGTIQGYQEFVDDPFGVGTVSYNGTCQSCLTGPCDPMCTGGATCVASCPPCAAEDTIANDYAAE
jgi:hypothetical protein